ncbi:Acyl-coenzyme A:6-aminopenicillanic acid acyl-transferase [Thermoplasmatales archaeon SCGC AB-539-C06]|nr:Acyl-coenzyme A:6-aminopenicillanic acid acyl-transferase [Thermoplasmatales archaeon SCGC AB-539-C06]
MYNKKIISFCIVGVFIGLSISPSIIGKSTQINILNVNAYKMTIALEDYDNVQIEQTSKKISMFPQVINNEVNSDFDYGQKMGQEHFYLYHLLTNLFTIFIKEEDKAKIMGQVDNQKKILEKYCPFFLEELKGLSNATLISLEKIIATQIFLSSFFENQCTTTASTVPATRYNETFLTMNYDPTVTSPLLPIIRIFFTRDYHINRVVSGYNYAYLGIPVLYEIPLINERGLGFGGNGIGITDDPDRHVDEGEGIPTYFLARLTMMSCSNVSEVARFWRDSDRSSDKGKNWPNHWDYSTSVWCDREGGILMIEQSHSYIITVFGDSTDISDAPEGILWHANHHQWLDPNLTGSKYPSKYPSSMMRGNRARELLLENYGDITLDVCMAITQDHGGGTNPNRKDSSDICRHPDKNDTHITAFSWIVVPEKMTVYWTRGQPCSMFRGKFKEYDFSKVLDNKPPNTIMYIDGVLGSNNWFVSNVTVSLVSDDEMFETNKIFYRVDNDFWKVYENPIKIHNGGRYIIEYFSTDKAFNVEPINQDDILVDFEPPRLIVQRFKLGLFRMKFVGFAIDKTSKVDKIEFYLDDILQKSCYRKTI